MRKGAKMTVSEILEEVKTEMCDKRCKMPGIHRTVNEDKDMFYKDIYGDLIGIELADSDYCQNCPLNKL